jgi:hemerythrin-like metal-binding protein
MTAEMKWTEDLAIGIPLIDEQHKEWIERLRGVSEAIQAHMGQPKIVKALDFLVDYTNHHFGTEEKHMEAHAYPDLPAHRARHEELKTTLSNLIEGFEEDGATAGLADYLDNFMQNWLVQHIHDVDQRFGDFLKAKGVNLS